jgi:ribose transport system substrate-binding protein
VSLLDEAQDFQQHQAADARVTAEKLNVELDVLFAENNAILQIQQLYRVIRQQPAPRAILVESVSGEGLARVAQAAARAGIGWVLINRRVEYLDELRRQYPSLPIGTFSTDHAEIGRIQGRQLRALLPAAGRVLYVQGPSDTSAARDRLAGTREAIGAGRIELKIIDGQWTEESGALAVDRWLRLKRHDAEQPDAIACQNDMMALGARSALTALAPELGLARLPLIGADGLPEGGQRLVRLGQLTATVVVPSNTGPALHTLVRSFAGRAPFPAETLLIPTSYPELKTLVPPPPTAARPPRSSHVTPALDHDRLVRVGSGREEDLEG